MLASTEPGAPRRPIPERDPRRINGPGDDPLRDRPVEPPEPRMHGPEMRREGAREGPPVALGLSPLTRLIGPRQVRLLRAPQRGQVGILLEMVHAVASLEIDRVGL